MKILFIFSLYDYQSAAKPLQSQEQIRFGISYISSLLKSKGHSTDLLVITRGTKKSFILSTISQIMPDVIGFTAVVTEYEFILSIAKYIKSNFKSIFLIIGGPHASLNPEKVFNETFNAICIGEGEFPILELVEQLKQGRKPSNIKNLWIRENGKIERNPTREFIQDLDILPFPDRVIWQKWINFPYTRHVIFLGRGCPHQCSYCCNHAISKLASGKYVRFRSVNNIMKELKEIINKYPKIKEIYFEVETIGININFAVDLCLELEKYNEEIGYIISYGINLRIVPKIDFETLFKALNRANFRFINIGIESGSEMIRTHILNRIYSNKDVINCVKLARRYNLKVSTYNMIGIPEETYADFEKTIKCNRICLPDWMQLSIFFPYPGTELYKICCEKGLLKSKMDERMERWRAILNLENFTKKQIQKEFEWFNFKVYRGYKPFYLIIARVLFSKLNSNPLFNRIYRIITRFSILKRIELLFDSSS